MLTRGELLCSLIELHAYVGSCGERHISPGHARPYKPSQKSAPVGISTRE